MLTNQSLTQRISINNNAGIREINRLLAAAVVSQKFCALLLSEPAKALEQGFAGEQFLLSADQYNLVLSLHGSSLPEFAEQLSKHIPARTASAQSVPTERYPEAYSPIV